MSEDRVRRLRVRLGARKVGNRLCYPRSVIEVEARRLGRSLPEPARPAAVPVTRRRSSIDSPVVFAVLGVVFAIAFPIWLIFHGESSSVPPAPAPTRSPTIDVSAYLRQIADEPHAVCRDGTISYSVARQGTCSWHGGVAYWVRP
jgi:hypothetical protein